MRWSRHCTPLVSASHGPLLFPTHYPPPGSFTAFPRSKRARAWARSGRPKGARRARKGARWVLDRRPRGGWWGGCGVALCGGRGVCGWAPACVCVWGGGGGGVGVYHGFTSALTIIDAPIGEASVGNNTGTQQFAIGNNWKQFEHSTTSTTQVPHCWVCCCRIPFVFDGP